MHRYGVYLFFFLSLLTVNLLPHNSNAQNINQMDLTHLNVDNLSDAQIKQFMSEARQSGLSDSQIDQMALSKGMSPAQLKKLHERIAAIKRKEMAKMNALRPGAIDTSIFGRSIYNGKPDSLSMRISRIDSALSALRPKVFGEDLFNNPNLTFEPNLRIPTPANYQIGPGDEIIISVYGYSQNTFDLTVSNEGSINIPNVGIVYLNGLTMEEARQRLKSKLSGIYAGLRTGNTQLQVSLGAIRSIKVTIIGEATQPGAYTLPSLATVFNALYACGGPGQYGGYRNIQVIRDNKVIDTLDVYDFLMSGDQTHNIRLQDQDVIRIPTFKDRVLISGEVKRPGYFDIKPRETLQDLITYAGGFTDEAYKAMIHVVRLTDKEKAVADVYKDNFEVFHPLDGDEFEVGNILNRFKNRVAISGAVFHPGYFELTSGLTLSELIKKADGLKEDAFLPRGYLIRLNPDRTQSSISFNVGEIMSGQAPDIVLKREDAVFISSIFDLHDLDSVTISGAVRNAGKYSYEDSMTLGDLLLKAGGFKEGATPNRIAISRRIYNSNATSLSANMAEVYIVNVDRNLQLDNSDFMLHPYDVVNVRMSPGFETQKQVTIKGQVLYPGKYTISQKNERLSALVKRSGGLSANAYVKGAYLKRTFQSDKQLDYNKFLKQKKLQESLIGDTILHNLDTAILENNYIGINLQKALDNPGSVYDITLRPGDELTIPLKNSTVRISGEVLYPVTAIYNPDKSFKYYISQAGGFSDDARPGRAFIIYPSGQAERVKHFLFFRNYPKVEPGSSIYVPEKPHRNGINAREVIGISSGLASLALSIVAIINLTK